MQMLALTLLFAATLQTPLDEKPVALPDYASIPYIEQYASPQRRSALSWADRFNVPVLIMHGGADRANHTLAQWRIERDAHAIAWFRDHLKAQDQKSR
jgi:hypothetical protein